MIGGKDRGKKGKVLRVEPGQEQTAFMRGGSEHGQAPRAPAPGRLASPARREQVGGVIEKEGGIHLSNVMVLDPKDGKPTRVGVETEGGKRYRIARRSGTRLD